MGIEVYIINVLLAIPIFFSCRFIFKKFIKDTQSRRVATWITTLVLTPLLYIGLIILWVSAVTYYPAKKFHSENWKSNQEKRYEMTKDLLESRILMGKTKDQVVALLGLEDNAIESDKWVYDVGFRPSMFGIDPDILEIEFKAGIVTKCWVRET
jgi:hypothetical protein